MRSVADRLADEVDVDPGPELNAARLLAAGKPGPEGSSESAPAQPEAVHSGAPPRHCVPPAQLPTALAVFVGRDPQRNRLRFRETGDLFNEARVLDRLGDDHHSAGDPTKVLCVWQSARAVLHAFDPVGAGEVQLKIDRHEEGRAAVTSQAHFVHCSLPTLPPPTNTLSPGAN
ncbi:hypothetical protein [Streptomyces sp. NPDC005799]|uniref:hypothetical protein n=1 Tax=Streptomyces sp. NPDC005799 TaxID=3154678 RepID=UPI0033D1FD9D